MLYAVWTFSKFTRRREAVFSLLLNWRKYHTLSRCLFYYFEYVLIHMVPHIYYPDFLICIFQTGKLYKNFSLKRQHNAVQRTLTFEIINSILTRMEKLTLSWRRLLLYRNMDWFLYDNGLRHERVKVNLLLSLNTRVAQQMWFRQMSVFLSFPF